MVIPTQDEVHSANIEILEVLIKRNFSKPQILAALISCLVCTMEKAGISEQVAHETFERLKGTFTKLRRGNGNTPKP